MVHTKANSTITCIFGWGQIEEKLEGSRKTGIPGCTLIF
jgi:hypothetical protein